MVAPRRVAFVPDVRDLRKRWIRAAVISLGATVALALLVAGLEGYIVGEARIGQATGFPTAPAP